MHQQLGKQSGFLYHQLGKQSRFLYQQLGKQSGFLYQQLFQQPSRNYLTTVARGELKFLNCFLSGIIYVVVIKLEIEANVIKINFLNLGRIQDPDL